MSASPMTPTWLTGTGPAPDSLTTGETAKPNLPCPILILNQKGVFDRTARAGNTYYDSINFAQKINNWLGWSVASEWSGGGSFAVSPSIGFRLPGGGIFDKMSLGLGYYLWKLETYNVFNNQTIKWDVLMDQIHLDYLWKVHEEFNFGIHIERFWQLSATESSPDVAGTITSTGKIAEFMNFRPGIAWLPQGNLKGLIVNAGIYDLFAHGGQGGGPHYSFGFEYTPQPGMRKIVSGKGKSKKVKYFPEKRNWFTNSHFRAGIYNMLGQGNPWSLITLGYGYNLSDNLEIGYWGGFGFAGASGAHDQNFGLTWTW